MFGVQGEGLRAIEYFEKYRDTATSLGDDRGIKDAEAHIQQEKMKLGLASMSINDFRREYAFKIKEFGKESPQSIVSGTRLAVELHRESRVIQSERLFAEILTMCCRVHGHDHPDTKWVKEQFECWKVRRVGIEQNDDMKIYHFLGYTDSSRKRCSVKGPLEEPRNELFEKTMVVDTKCTIF